MKFQSKLIVAAIVAAPLFLAAPAMADSTGTCSYDVNSGALSGSVGCPAASVSAPGVLTLNGSVAGAGSVSSLSCTGTGTASGQLVVLTIPTTGQTITCP